MKTATYDSRVVVPVANSVPHYNRGRTRIPLNPEYGATR